MGIFTRGIRIVCWIFPLLGLSSEARALLPIAVHDRLVILTREFLHEAPVPEHEHVTLAHDVRCRVALQVAGVICRDLYERKLKSGNPKGPCFDWGISIIL